MFKDRNIRESVGFHFVSGLWLSKSFGEGLHAASSHCWPNCLRNCSSRSNSARSASISPERGLQHCLLHQGAAHTAREPPPLLARGRSPCVRFGARTNAGCTCRWCPCGSTQRRLGFRGAPPVRDGPANYSAGKAIGIAQPTFIAIQGGGLNVVETNPRKNDQWSARFFIWHGPCGVKANPLCER